MRTVVNPPCRFCQGIARDLVEWKLRENGRTLAAYYSEQGGYVARDKNADPVAAGRAANTDKVNEIACRDQEVDLARWNLEFSP